ncbi:MAG: hypothetical protein GY771_10740 [bacterium]|nr:hypothetical protein [bacterium]
MKKLVIAMFITLVTVPVSSDEPEVLEDPFAPPPWEPSDEFVGDRVCVEEVQLFDDPNFNVEKTGPIVPRWTFGQFREKSENGVELIRFEDGREGWAPHSSFYPVYRVTSDEPVEVLHVYYADPPEDGKKPGHKPDAASVGGYLQPGEPVAAAPEAQALMDTYLITAESGLGGYADAASLEPVGNPGRNW